MGNAFLLHKATKDNKSRAEDVKEMVMLKALLNFTLSMVKWTPLKTIILAFLLAFYFLSTLELPQ